MRSPKHFVITNDVTQRVNLLVRSRLPWLVVGLMGGLVSSVLVSKFENILSTNLYLVFFIPVIVYISDAVGTQTETIYIRNLATFKDNFAKYLAKEILVGCFLGIILGAILGLVAFLWLGSAKAALTVSLALFINTIIAPVVAIVIPEILFKENFDPALGGGPFTTVVQDFISLLIYFLVATAIIL